MLKLHIVSLFFKKKNQNGCSFRLDWLRNPARTRPRELNAAAAVAERAVVGIEEVGAWQPQV